MFRRNFAQSCMVNHFNFKLAQIRVKSVVLRKVGNVNFELRDIDTGKVAVYDCGSVSVFFFAFVIADIQLNFLFELLNLIFKKL